MGQPSLDAGGGSGDADCLDERLHPAGSEYGQQGHDSTALDDDFDGSGGQ